MANPFSSLFLILIALAAFAPAPALGTGGRAGLLCSATPPAASSQALPDGYFRAQDLNRWGVVANFLISATVVLAFSTRLALTCGSANWNCRRCVSASPATRASSRWPPMPPRWHMN